MSFSEKIDTLTSTDKLMLSNCIRKLLRETFIVRDKEEDRKIYNFATRKENFAYISEWFKIGEFELKLDSNSGVLMLDCDAKDGCYSTRHHFTIKTTIAILCLWNIYLERMHEKSLHKNIVIGMLDINNELEKYGDRKDTMKKDWEDIFKELKAFNLIDTNGKLGSENFNIVLYPSLQFALDLEEMKRYVEDRNEIYQGGSEDVE